MSAKLPVFVDPVHFARLGITCEGTLPVANMGRLVLASFSAEDAVSVTLAFEMQGKTPIIRGQVNGAFWLTCQRCMEPMQLEVDHAFTLAVVSSEDQVAMLAENVEPLLLTEKEVPVSQIVEDELIIVLPDIPTHATGVCELAFRTDEQPLQASEKRENPFQLLQGLKN